MNYRNKAESYIVTSGGDVRVVTMDELLNDVVNFNESISNRTAEVELLEVESDDKPCVYRVPVFVADSIFTPYESDNTQESNFSVATVQLVPISDNPTEVLKKQLLDQAIKIEAFNLRTKAKSSIIGVADALSLESLEDFNTPSHLICLDDDEFIMLTAEDLKFETAIRDSTVYAGIISNRRSIYKTKAHVVK